ncbi:PalC, putative [Coccidioides posadasii C735 delta SOWgp]|uniref:pH-response regulator protein palC n=1 Tax=Coccidioides posadasii (strain C735) TaxID=222929 RepID=C5PGG9_COCP7|nr:PalC, putative [Coccidioides posadasii C735 delta SOWgp]EER23622.1 PalC, putative [Coccidioides posadasii C735 delta SOWgp]|eukprot:XP_003065767.1 PalC, putative [Coccidioides posadasii C735 delta SOWgp]
MVFSFSLPTTSHLSFQSYLISPTHPSLPSCASTARHALRVALKKHKATLPSQRAAHLPHILKALNEYIPYLFALSRGLSSNPASGSGAENEDVDVVLRAEIEVEWRATLSSPASSLHVLHRGGRDRRIKGCGLDFEVAFVLTTLGYVLSLLARTKILKTLYANTTPTVEQKTAAAQGAMKNLIAVSSVHTFLASSGLSSAEVGNGQISGPVPDLDPSTQSALSSLAMAEATLLAVVKDDAYLSTCIQARNKHDTEWMIKAPDIPKVRTLLFARLCIRAAEYAEQAAASAGAVKSCGSTSPESVRTDRRKLDEDLISYMRVLARVARAKACRFFGIDAEMTGKVGEGIAWLRAGKSALGIKGSLEGDEEVSGSKGKGRIGFSRLKTQWSERREERKLEETTSTKKGEPLRELDWGDDAGKEEEERVLEMLESKWTRMNNTINTQAIPSSASYLSNLPSGRDIHPPPGPYIPPLLDSEHLARMRAPPESPEPVVIAESSEEEGDIASSGRSGGYF